MGGMWIEEAAGNIPDSIIFISPERQSEVDGGDTVGGRATDLETIKGFKRQRREVPRSQDVA